MHYFNYCFEKIHIHPLTPLLTYLLLVVWTVRICMFVEMLNKSTFPHNLDPIPPSDRNCSSSESTHCWKAKERGEQKKHCNRKAHPLQTYSSEHLYFKSFVFECQEKKYNLLRIVFSSSIIEIFETSTIQIFLGEIQSFGNRRIIHVLCFDQLL